VRYFVQWYAGTEALVASGSSPIRALARCRYERIRRAVKGLPCGHLSDHERLIVLRRLRADTQEGQ
jgi:hypothetical protein